MADNKSTPYNENLNLKRLKQQIRINLIIDIIKNHHKLAPQQ